MRILLPCVLLAACSPSLNAGDPSPDEDETPAPVAPTEGTTLHAISGTDSCATVPVTLQQAQGPVVLALSAYSSTTWRIDNPGEVEIERVMLGGYEPHTLLGLPDDVPVDRYIAEEYTGASFWRSEGVSTSNDGPDDFFEDVDEDTLERDEYVATIEALSGLPLTSSQSNYEIRAAHLHEGGDFAEDGEVHLVGAYQSSNGNWRSCGNGIGTIEVHVVPADVPTILVLTAYDAVDWQVVLEDGAELGGVLLGGYHGQTVTGVPDNVRVLQRGFWWRQDHELYQEWLTDRVEEIVGSPVLTTQYSYAPESVTVP